MEERVRTSTAFLQAVPGQSQGSSAAHHHYEQDGSIHAHTRDQNSVQTVAKKGTPGPIKAKVHATRTKQMVITFFDAQGMVYPNYVPRGKTVNAAFILESLWRFCTVSRLFFKINK